MFNNMNPNNPNVQNPSAQQQYLGQGVPSGGHNSMYSIYNQKQSKKSKSLRKSQGPQMINVQGGQYSSPGQSSMNYRNN